MISPSVFGRSWTNQYVTSLPWRLISLTTLQLFLEEERERELEHLYENDLAETLNQSDGTIGQGEDADDEASAEVTAVSKQTTETLMSGERIIEALDLADKERAALRDFEDQKARADTLESGGLQPPSRNPILAALDLDPESYVLRIIEKIPRTALYDALLVLPFDKVLSLMQYLDMWAKKVRFHDITLLGLV